jgi:hypothetical protein
LPFFSDIPLLNINTSAIRKYRQERNREKTLTAATVNRDLSVLRRVLYWGVEEGYLTSNPLARLRMERERRTKRPVLSLREEQLLLAASPEHLQRIILCALHTGMRRGEILSQRWEDIDFDNRILHVSHSKTPEGEAREIPLTSRLYEMLHANRQRRGPVFTYGGDAIKIIKTTWASSLASVGNPPLPVPRSAPYREYADDACRSSPGSPPGIIGHSSQRSRDVNDRYTQIELPEKREAIRKLEAWLDSQALLLQQGVTAPLLLKSGDQTAPTTEEQTNDGNQHSAPAA